MLGNADGTFRLPVTVDVSSGDLKLVAGEFNGNGNVDLAALSLGFVANGLGFVSVPSLRVLFGNGDGTFMRARTFVLQQTPHSLTAARFNSDSLPDFAVTDPSNSVGILLNTSASTGVDLAAHIFGGGTVQNPSYIVTANNRGPQGATGVILTDTLPDNVSFVSAAPSQGTCNWSGLKIVCEFGSLVAGGIALVKIDVIAPDAPYTITNSATVTADQADQALKNNAAKLTLTYSP